MTRKRTVLECVWPIVSFSMILGAEMNSNVAFGSLDRYNVVWETPSKDFSGSMPLGNGDIGLNVWVEENGDLLFYIGKTDSWGDNGRLLKVGRVRISLSPNPLAEGAAFRQTLNLRTAEIIVEIMPKNENRSGTGFQPVNHGQDAHATSKRGILERIWVDANHPVIHVTVEGNVEVTARATIELWRTERYELPSLEVSDIYLDRSKPDQKHAPTIVEPDVILKNQAGRIGWYHRNVRPVGPELTMRIQGLSDCLAVDPLLDRTFGAVVTSQASKRVNDFTLQTEKGTSHRFSIYVLTRHPSAPEEWLDGMETLITEIEQKPFEQRRRAHEEWWAEFWNRSYIRIRESTASPRDMVTSASGAFVVSQAYHLQRFINACAGRGHYPIKFNGSIFTVPFPGAPGDADYRRWGPGYWWQNTRLPYMSMCASGDFDLMHSLFRMYTEEVMDVSRVRTKRYCNHDGAFIPECVYFWGAIFSETYGWTPFEERGDDKLQESGWHKWEWVSGLELTWMMLDYYEHTLDRSFLRDRLLPTAHEVLTFFDRHYKTDDRGKLVMHPAQALETWWDCTNPMPELAGLHAVTQRLLTLAEELTAPEQRGFWQALNNKLPDPPTREVDGVRMLAPAEKFDTKRNIENPELYAVFPFRLFAVGQPRTELAREALKHRWDKGNSGWRQDDIFMAYLGLAEQAKGYVAGRARNKDPNSRFPAFCGPNYDWVPDQDHGGVLLKVVQAMLLQAEGENISLFPAWPKDWDVEFKLHAPLKTIVEGAYLNGNVEHLRVTPEGRAKDLVIMEPR